MSSFEEIDIHQAKEIIEEGNVTIIDIRDEASYEEAHIQGAHRVDDDNVEDFLKKTDMSKPLMCYCFHGFTSQSAGEYFRHNGFGQVYSIAGGFEEWRKSYSYVSSE